MAKAKQCFLLLTVLILINFFVTTINIPKPQIQKLAEEALENGARDPRFAEVYRIKKHPLKDIKYILLWTPREYEPFKAFSDGQETFINRGCSDINCYVTTDRSLFGDNVEKFDAIAFNGRNIRELEGDLPKTRLPHQIYIYFNEESPSNYPICTEEFDNFFNWTATFRFDSELLLPYFHIKNSSGDIIGPNINMKWTEQETYHNKDFENILLNKTKAAAWFVSNCKTISKREKYVEKLIAAVNLYNLTVDVYGKCSKKTCSRKTNKLCTKRLETEYYFYFAFENSIDVDYVSEKILTGLQFKTVPIVYGGANYSRFAPPGSYINARAHTPEALAKIMATLIASPEKYKQYFKWYNSYSFDKSEAYKACNLCRALNNKSMIEKSPVYRNFRKWWNNPNEVKLCSTGWLNYISSFFTHS